MLNLKKFISHKQVDHVQEEDKFTLRTEFIIPLGELVVELIRIDAKKWFRTNKEKKFYKAAIASMNAVKEVTIKVEEEIVSNEDYKYCG